MAARNKCSVYLSDGEQMLIEKLQVEMERASPERGAVNLSSVVRAAVRHYYAHVTAKKPSEPCGG